MNEINSLASINPHDAAAGRLLKNFSQRHAPTRFLPISHIETAYQLQPSAITHAPDAEAAMRNFLEALKNNDFTAMYALLSKASQ